MSLKELAKQVVKKEYGVKVERECSLGKTQIEWELKEEIICLGSQMDDMKKQIEDLSYQNAVLAAQVYSLEQLLGDLQIQVVTKSSARLKSKSK